MKFLVTVGAIAVFAWIPAAQAQATGKHGVAAEAAAPRVITVSGSETLACDHRFRDGAGAAAGGTVPASPTAAF